MKLQVTQENLSKALGSVSKVANTRGTLPILSNVVLKTIDGRLSIAATNLEIAITHYIGAKIKETGSITVPARLMQDFINSLPSGIIDLNLEDSKLHISTDKYKSTVNGMSAEDYPVTPDITNGKSWTISAKLLKQSLQQVVVSASSDESRPVLTGVYWHTFEGFLYIVATDSYRLAEKKLIATKDEIDLLLPVSAMQDLLRIIGDEEGDITVTHDDQQVLLKVGDIELITRLIDGKYPDYRKLIPKSFSSDATLKKADLSNITKVSSLFARESAGSVTLKLDTDSQQVSIKSIATQIGENTASASAVVTSDGDITLNSRYILDALHSLFGSDVTIAFNGKLEPCVLTDPSAADYVHIIMPLKS